MSKTSLKILLAGSLMFAAVAPAHAYIAMNGGGENGFQNNGISLNAVGMNGGGINGLTTNGGGENGGGANGLTTNGGGANGGGSNALTANGGGENGVALGLSSFVIDRVELPATR